MLETKELQYNLVSQGSLHTPLYGYPNELFTLLSEYGYDEKLHNTKQLGALQNYLRGAHHTRYEYVFLQWTLAHEMCKRNKGSGLGSNLKQSFNEFKIGDKNPTKAEILQILSILTNIGHLPATFTSSNVLLTLLNKNENRIRTNFRKGLYTKDKKILDILLKSNDVYKIHLVNSLFNLHRIDKRNDKSRKIKELSLWVLREYILREDSDYVELWERYDLIRKISYLILDSNYAPVPFKLDFSSILMLFDDRESILLNKQSNFQKTLNKMDNVLEETLYLESNTLLYTAVHKELLIDKYNKTSQEFLEKESIKNFKIRDIKQILSPHLSECNLNDIFKHSNDLIEIDWEENCILDLTYKGNIVTYLGYNNSNDLEDYLKKKIGASTIRLSINLSPSKTTTKIVISIRKTYKNKVKKSLEIIKELLSLKEKLVDANFEYTSRENEQYINDLLDFHFMHLFKGNQVKYNAISGIETPFICENGYKKIIEKINEFMDKIQGNVDKDLLHEFKVLKKYFEKSKFSGLHILYLGGITLLSTKTNQSSLEIDSLILRPNKLNEDFVHILEAKNTAKGESVAQSQLKNNLSKGLNNLEVIHEVGLLNERNAIAKVTVIKE